MSDTEVKDIDCLTAMMSIFTHAAEKCIMEIERIYAKEYEAGKEFLALQKKYGSVKAKEIMGSTVSGLIRNNDRYRLGKLLEQLHRTEQELNHCTEWNMKAFSGDKMTMCGAFDALQSDATDVCRMYALLGNVQEKDLIKVESTIRILGKGHRVSERVINSFQKSK